MWQVRLEPAPRRPSGLLLDKESGDLYLLNLQGEAAVVRYCLQEEEVQVKNNRSG